MGYETYRLGALSGTRQVLDAVIREQPERFMEPCRTPPLPAETPPIPRPHQMAPHLLLDPLPHKGKAPARVPDPEVVDPAPQLRVDLSDQRLDRLGLEASEPLLELPQQRRALLPLRRVLRPPASAQRARPPEVKAQESKALPPTQVHDPTLLLVQPHIEFRQLLSEPPGHRLHQPVLPTIVVHEDHQVVGIARVLDVRVRTVSRDRLGPLQHGIHLGEIDVAEEGERSHRPEEPRASRTPSASASTSAGGLGRLPGAPPWRAADRAARRRSRPPNPPRSPASCSARWPRPPGQPPAGLSVSVDTQTTRRESRLQRSAAG